MIKVYVSTKESNKDLQKRVINARNQFQRLELAKQARANHLGPGIYKNYVKHSIVINTGETTETYKITKKKVESINKFMNNVFSSKNYLKD